MLITLNLLHPYTLCIELRAAQKLQAKCDQLIVFAQSASSDPTFSLTLRLLKQILPNTHLTEGDVRNRYQELVSTGRAAELRALPHMQRAIAQKVGQDNGSGV